MGLFLRPEKFNKKVLEIPNRRLYICGINNNKMAHLSQQQYAQRNENAARKMSKNSEIESLTPEQHEALSNLCTVRHEFHCDLDHVVWSDDRKNKKKLVEANIALAESGLSAMSFIPTHPEDYIDIDTIDELYEIEDVPEDDNEREEWRSDNYYRIMGELSELHNKIEDYLRNIDSEHGTQYCPTGALRVF